ncbi:MAG TPA: hypothetical protein PLG41_14010 [Leptospiraceae bacterium]|nr:hypothetical protein [Leptospiraceae bacterium]
MANFTNASLNAQNLWAKAKKVSANTAQGFANIEKGLVKQRRKTKKKLTTKGILR